MRCPNVHQSIPRSLRYHQNRCNRLCSCSLHNRCNFCFLGEGGGGGGLGEGKRQADEERQTRATGEEAPRSLRACLRSPDKSEKQKNNARCAGYHSWTKIKCGILEKKKNKTKPTGKKGRPCLLKNKTCFERNEKTV